MKGKLVVILAIMALAFLGTAGAQVDTSPGVARVSLIHGDVSSQRGDSGDWAAAVLNQPVVAGDTISTGDRSQAEIQLDPSDILRLGNNAQAKVATLTRTQIQVQVGQGLVYYSVFKESEAQIEIDTPNVAIRPTSSDGVYRIEVNGGDTRVVVRKGSADISTPQGSTRLEKGQAALVRGTADSAEYKLVSAPSKDSWDSWNSQRDSTIRNAQSWRHTNSNYVGSEDLDAYGRWESVPDYGSVWVPTVAVGWAPYRAGRWVWEPYWGWTWVSYEPWGWAPYHYGRWMWWNSSWVWWPGPVTPYYRPFWAPAYVSFFGFGGHWGFGVGFGFGSVGWLPIGPCDHFYPWWGGYRNHFNVVNVTNITNITNIYNVHHGHGFDGIAPLHRGDKFSNLRRASTDPRIREAISTVPRDHFGTGRSAAKPVGAKEFREGRMMTGNLPLVPTKANLSVSDRPAGASSLASAERHERFFTRKQPEAPQSFEHQAAQVQQAIARHPDFARGQKSEQGNAQRGYGAVTESNRSAAQSTMRGSPGADKAHPAGNDGWNRFGGSQEAQNRVDRKTEPGAGSNRSYSPASTPNENVRQTQTPNSERYGWHKFSGNAENNSRGNASTRESVNRETRSAAPASTPPARSEAQPDRGAGWQHFERSTPAESSRPSAAPGERPVERWSAPADGPDRGGSSYTPQSRSYTRPESGPSSEAGRPAYRSSESSRPPLNLRQPIVTPRTGGASSGGGRTSSGGGGSRGSSSGGGGSRGGSSGGGGSHGGSSGGGGSHGGHSR